MGKEIYLFGGIDEDDKKNDLYATNIGTNTINHYITSIVAKKAIEQYFLL
jgi:hypothetical protein